MNSNWLKRVFGGEGQNISALRVPYGMIRLRLLPRGYDADYTVGQIALALRMAGDYGGIGARLQHGFGQVEYGDFRTVSNDEHNGWPANISNATQYLGT